MMDPLTKGLGKCVGLRRMKERFHHRMQVHSLPPPASCPELGTFSGEDLRPAKGHSVKKGDYFSPGKLSE